MTQYLGFAFALVIFLAFCFFQWLHKKERSELNDRVMAKHLQEFNYYLKGKFKEDLTEVKKLRAEARSERDNMRKKGEELIEKEFDESEGEKKKPQFEEYEEDEISPEQE